MQTKNAFEVKADLPGVDKKDIKVNVEGDVLTISHDRSAEKKEKKEENGIKYHVRSKPLLTMHIMRQHCYPEQRQTLTHTCLQNMCTLGWDSPFRSIASH